MMEEMDRGAFSSLHIVNYVIKPKFRSTLEVFKSAHWLVNQAEFWFLLL